MKHNRNAKRRLPMGLQKLVTQRGWMILTVLLFAIVGSIVLLRSFAAVSTASIEPEAIIPSSPASTGTDASASGNKYIQFGGVQNGSGLSINVSQNIRPFNKKMKGIGLANWTFTKGWNKPFVGEVQGLPQAIQAIDPGLIRYAGGLWANSVGFDRTRTQITAYTEWTKNGNTYFFDYGTDELASLDAFAKTVGADVMIQVNVRTNDPAMWADLVRYAKERGFTSFKYYEFANELDLETFNGNGISPEVYASRVTAYQTAMLAADSTVKFVGGVPATASDIMRNGYASGGNQVSQYITQALPAARASGKDLDSVSYHWYQTDGGDTTASQVTEWSYGFTPASTEFWRQSYAREWSGQVPPWIRSSALANYPDVQQGVSELGVNSADDKPMNGNHMSALWYSDVLGRMAYNGVDWVTQWDSYASTEEEFALLYPDNDQTPTPSINARPAYYAYVMYNKYFGNQLVKSASFDESRLSVWASTDSRDPGKLKLRITNLSAAPITTPVSISGFAGGTAHAYVLSSTAPTNMAAGSESASAPTTINGVKINGNNVAASLASIQPQNFVINGSSFSYTFPAYSSVAIVIDGQ